MARRRRSDSDEEVKLGVDFSDLLNVFKQMELQAQHKDCDYCEKRMKTTLLKDAKDDTKNIGVAFRCLNCGWECTEISPGEYDD